MLNVCLHYRVERQQRISIARTILEGWIISVHVHQLILYFLSI